MGLMTADFNVSFRGNPVAIPLVSTSAETWYRGSLIFQLLAGGVSKAYASGGLTGTPFIGISPFQQTIAAGGQGIVYVGPFIAIFPDTTAGLAVGDEGDDIGMATNGSDNWKDCVKYTTGIGADKAALIGNLVRFVSTTEVWVAVKDPCIYGVAKAAVSATAFHL